MVPTKLPEHVGPVTLFKRHATPRVLEVFLKLILKSTTATKLQKKNKKIFGLTLLHSDLNKETDRTQVV